MPADSTRPGGPRYTPAQRRLLTAAAGLIVAAVAGAAYALTYDVFRELALLGGVGDRWAPLYPAIADTLTALTILSLVITRNARWWTRLPRWTLLILLIAGGAAVSVQDSVWGMGSLPRDAVRAGVAVAPHVLLVIAVWLWLTMVKQIRVARPAPEEVAPVEPQRGHVKVLAPGAPEPLALEAPARAEPEPAFVDDHEPLIPFTPDEPPADEPEDAGTAELDDEYEDEDDFEDALEDDFEDEADEAAGPQWRSLSSEPEPPPLDALPGPRPHADTPVSPPSLLPTDVELVRSRSRDLDGARERPSASTTRPDIVVPPAYSAADTGDADDEDAQPVDRPEDPDAGEDAGEMHPPPSSSFRSGPTPPAD